jgi:hypothetical protein
LLIGAILIKAHIRKAKEAIMVTDVRQLAALRRFLAKHGFVRKSSSISGLVIPPPLSVLEGQKPVLPGQYRAKRYYVR